VEALQADTTFFAVRTTDAVKTKLGPSSLVRGDNELSIAEDETRFIFEHDTDAGDQLDATYNYWFAAGQLTDSTDIKNRLAPSGYNIDVSNFRTGTPGGCPGLPTALEEEAGTIRPPSQGQLSGRSTSELAPTVLSLSRPHPNPVRGSVTLELTVPEGAEGSYHLLVYDVQGRRVLESSREVAVPGRYKVVWDGSSGNGNQVAAGVYFLKLEGPARFLETRKVTLLR
jgi:hypothetical protein